MSYVDGFVAAVPTANKEAFLQHAQHVSAFYKECGVLQQVECWGDDVPQGKLRNRAHLQERPVVRRRAGVPPAAVETGCPGQDVFYVVAA